MKKKIMGKSLNSKELNKPSTITRAGITADIRYTRGKQLVEHNPFKLIPDPHNPRPGEIIDDAWLKKNLLLGTEHALCRFNQETGEYEIPDLSDLNVTITPDLEESYHFLKDLAFSIRNEGIIEPVEIFLADRENEPDYFSENDLDYGYVILEGHQRRLAAMMGQVETITCIEITDESMLAKLKIQHRKLRRQLSENNLRKGLTVAQNFEIVRMLLASEPKINAKELSSIIGLNEAIAAALKKVCTNPERFPFNMISMLKSNALTYKSLRNLVAKSYAEIERELDGIQEKKVSVQVEKVRGRNGGAIKRTAIFKVNDHHESIILQKFLIDKFPELGRYSEGDFTYKNLEILLDKMKELALRNIN